MSQKEAQKRFIQKRKDKGLCILCGEPLDRQGVHCKKCREKINKETKKTREFYKQNGICPRCGKNEILGDEKMCPECKARTYETVMKNRDKDHYNKTHREWSKKEYQKRIEAGICTRCGKRDADKGYRTCGLCREKDTNKRRIRNYKQPREDRIKQGLCYFCDNPVVDGLKVCEEHRQLAIKNSRSDKAKEIRKQLVEQGILY